MRKITSVIILVLAMCTMVCVSCTDGDGTADVAVTGGIDFFKGTWDEALAKAKKENKMVFLDAYASWCGPCQKMKKNVFTDTVVAAFFNDNFVNVAADMEKGEGVMIADKFGIDSYPTLIIVNGDGMQLARESGYQDPEELIDLAKTVLETKR